MISDCEVTDLRKKKNKTHKKNFKKSRIRKLIFKIKFIIAVLELLQATATVFWFYEKFFKKDNKNKKGKKNK